MSKDEMFAVKQLSWVVTCALCWLYTSSFDPDAKFFLWFWGIAFWIDVVVLGVSVTAVALEL